MLSLQVQLVIQLLFARFFNKYLMLAMFHPHSVLSFPPLLHADKIICLIPFLKKLFPFFSLGVKTCVDLVKFLFIRTKQGVILFPCLLSQLSNASLKYGEFGCILHASPFVLYFYYPASIKKHQAWNWCTSALGNQDFCTLFGK